MHRPFTCVHKRFINFCIEKAWLMYHLTFTNFELNKTMQKFGDHALVIAIMSSIEF